MSNTYNTVPVAEVHMERSGSPVWTVLSLSETPEKLSRVWMEQRMKTTDRDPAQGLQVTERSPGTRCARRTLWWWVSIRTKKLMQNLGVFTYSFIHVFLYSD